MSRMRLVSFSIPAHLHDRLRDVNRRTKIPVAELIRQGVELVLEKREYEACCRWDSDLGHAVHFFPPGERGCECGEIIVDDPETKHQRHKEAAK